MLVLCGGVVVLCGAALWWCGVVQCCDGVVLCGGVVWRYWFVVGMWCGMAVVKFFCYGVMWWYYW